MKPFRIGLVTLDLSINQLWEGAIKGLGKRILRNWAMRVKGEHGAIFHSGVQGRSASRSPGASPAVCTAQGTRPEGRFYPSNSAETSQELAVELSSFSAGL